MTGSGFAVLAVVATIGLILFGVIGKRTRGAREHLARFVYPGEPADLSVVVPAGDEAVVRDVLSEFAATYGATGCLDAGIAFTREDGRLVLRFPRGLQPEHFVFLVNFLRYPFSGNGIPQAYGVASVETALNALALPGVMGRAVVFVPEDDDEQDAVWLLPPSGEAWHYSFRAGAAVRRDPRRDRPYRNYWLPRVA